MAQCWISKKKLFSVATALLALLGAPTDASASNLWCKVNPSQKDAADAVDLPTTAFHKVKDQSRAAGIVGEASYEAISWQVASSLLGGDGGRKGSFILAKYAQPKWLGAVELTKADASATYGASSKALYLYNYSLSRNDDAFENIIVLIDIDKPVASVSVACLSAG